jgi:ABC-type glycerol-3-phosphate transport system permease component
MKQMVHIRILKILFLVVIMLVILVPLVLIMSLGFRVAEDVFEILPSTITLKNIPKSIERVKDWGGLTFVRMYANSVLVSATSILGIIIITCLAAFGFSHYKFKGKEMIFIAFILSFMIPVQVMLIPLFQLMKKLQLLKSYLVLILPYIAFGFPIAVLILRGFFGRVPPEIKEAAIIDGAKDFTIFTRIIMPLAKPAIATIITFSFMTVWNEFLFALVFIRKDLMMTIPIVLNRMSTADPYVVQWEIYGAMIFLTVIPVIVIFIFFQKWFIAGLSEGAVKG